MRRRKQKNPTVEQRLRRLETELSWARDIIYRLIADHDDQASVIRELELRINDEIVARELEWETAGSDIPF